MTDKSVIAYSSVLPLARCAIIGISFPPISWPLKGLFRAFIFEFSHLLGFFNNFFGLAFRELLTFSLEILSMATSAVTLPVLEFSIVILFALLVSSASFVDLIGRVSVDI